MSKARNWPRVSSGFFFSFANASPPKNKNPQSIPTNKTALISQRRLLRFGLIAGWYPQSTGGRKKMPLPNSDHAGEQRHPKRQRGLKKILTVGAAISTAVSVRITPFRVHNTIHFVFLLRF